MELFTADGLPVGPASRFSSKPSVTGAPSERISATDGGQLVSLYRLFVRLHTAGGNSSSSGKKNGGGGGDGTAGGGSGSAGNGDGGGPSSDGTSGNGTASAPSRNGSSNTGGGSGGGGASSVSHTVSGSLAAFLKPKEAAELQAFTGGGGDGGYRGANDNNSGGGGGIRSVLSDPNFSLGGTSVSGMRQLMRSDGDQHASPTSASASASAGGGASGTTTASTTATTFLGCDHAAWGRLLLAASTNNGAVAGAAPQAGTIAYPLFLLPTRFFPHVSKLRGFPARPTVNANGRNDMDDDNNGGGGDQAVVRNSNRSALHADEAPLRCALLLPSPSHHHSHSNSSHGHHHGSRSGSNSASQPREEEEEEGGNDNNEDQDAGACDDPNHARDAAALFHAQLMVETTARGWFCVPADTRVLSGGVGGEYDFSCLLFGCGALKV